MGTHHIVLRREVLTGWRVFPLPLDDLSAVPFSASIAAQQPALANLGRSVRGLSPGRDGPVLYRGMLNIEENAIRGATGHLADTYIDVRGWGKGLAFINGFNLGWYWPTVGPQGAQYVPGPLLQEGENEIVLLEVESAPSDPSVNLTPTPDFCGPSVKPKDGYLSSQPQSLPFDRRQMLPAEQLPERVLVAA